MAVLFMLWTNLSHQGWTWYIPFTPSAHNHSPGCIPSKQKGPGPPSVAPNEPPMKWSIVAEYPIHKGRAGICARPFHKIIRAKRAIIAPPKLYPAQRFSPRLRFQAVRIAHEMNQAIRGALSGTSVCQIRFFPPPMILSCVGSLIIINPATRPCTTVATREFLIRGCTGGCFCLY